MLSAKVIENAQQAEHYFSQDNYYTTEEGFEQSAWAGKGAAALGLSGGVHREQFMELLEGKVDGQELGKWVRNEETGQKEREHRPGIDLTFSAPKSVSLLAEVAGNEEVSKAHDVAVERAIAYLERVAAQAMGLRPAKIPATWSLPNSATILAGNLIRRPIPMRLFSTLPSVRMVNGALFPMRSCWATSKMPVPTIAPSWLGNYLRWGMKLSARTLMGVSR